MSLSQRSAQCRFIILLFVRTFCSRLFVEFVASVWTFCCRLFAISFIYVVGSPLARPLGRLGPLPQPPRGSLFCQSRKQPRTLYSLLGTLLNGLASQEIRKRNFVYQQIRIKGTLILSSYSNYIRMLVTWPSFCSRASCGCL